VSAAECTGVAASWCPIHGDCTCKQAYDLNDDRCPLHGSTSDHAEAEGEPDRIYRNRAGRCAAHQADVCEVCAADEAREACAQKVEQAGCRCHREAVRRHWSEERRGRPVVFRDSMNQASEPPGAVVVYLPDHEDWCPVALAEALRRQP
jgi:hypothetical protein